MENFTIILKAPKNTSSQASIFMKIGQIMSIRIKVIFAKFLGLKVYEKKAIAEKPGGGAQCAPPRPNRVKKISNYFFQPVG